MIGDIERLLTELTDAKIRYVVAGDVAIVLHGYLRAAFDLELLIDPNDRDRAGSLVARTKLAATFRNDDAFDDLYRRSTFMTIGACAIAVASIEDLIGMKQSLGRAQDAVDVQALLELQKPEIADAPFDGSFDGTRLRQARAGGKLTAVERLRWLDQWNAEVRSLLGRAS